MSRDGAVMRTRVRFRPGVMCELSLLLVLTLLRVFSPGSLVFIPPQKPTFSVSGPVESLHKNQLRLMWRAL